MVRCSANTVSGRRCKSHVHKEGLCWVHRVKEEITEEMCGICLDESSEINVVLTCGHIFCKSCIYTWIIKKYHDSTCPMCRQPIDQFTFYDARTWGIETGELFYIDTVHYNLCGIEEIEQYYLTAFYDIIPGSRIINALFEKIYTSMKGDTHAINIIKKLMLTTITRRSLYRKSELDLTNVKRLYYFVC